MRSEAPEGRLHWITFLARAAASQRAVERAVGIPRERAPAAVGHLALDFIAEEGLDSEGLIRDGTSGGDRTYRLVVDYPLRRGKGLRLALCLAVCRAVSRTSSRCCERTELKAGLWSDSQAVAERRDRPVGRDKGRQGGLPIRCGRPLPGARGPGVWRLRDRLSRIR